MEYRIVDLLDCIQDSDVPIRTENHASATKIKELTMEKINTENRKNKRPVRKAARVALIAAIIVLAPILTPVAMNFGWNPVHFGLIMTVNLSIGFITPPVGVNLFVASGMAEVPFVDLSKKIIPFILILLIALLVVTFCEPLVMTIPNAMMK